MAKFTFIIIETLRKEFEIEARDAREAYEQGKQNYYKSADEYVLTENDFEDVDFYITEADAETEDKTTTEDAQQ